MQKTTTAINLWSQIQQAQVWNSKLHSPVNLHHSNAINAQWKRKKCGLKKGFLVTKGYLSLSQRSYSEVWTSSVTEPTKSTASGDHNCANASLVPQSSCFDNVWISLHSVYWILPLVSKETICWPVKKATLPPFRFSDFATHLDALHRNGNILKSYHLKTK